MRRLRIVVGLVEVISPQRRLPSLLYRPETTTFRCSPCALNDLYCVHQTLIISQRYGDVCQDITTSTSAWVSVPTSQPASYLAIERLLIRAALEYFAQALARDIEFWPRKTNTRAALIIQ